jgi:uncharacterized protein (TIGR02598 family)
VSFAPILRHRFRTVMMNVAFASLTATRALPAGTPSKSGFSLIEVVLAMAIASVAILTLVGLIPQGMDTMRAAGDQAIEARIHQQLMSEMQMASFASLDRAFHGLEIYYDAQGEELGDNRGAGVASAAGSLEHIYTARVSVSLIPASVGGAPTTEFSFDGGLTTTEKVRFAVVEIAAVSGLGTEFNWELPENRRQISVYQSYVTDMGQQLIR